MSRDRIKYEVFYWLWRIWHMRLRRFFDRINPQPGIPRGYVMWAIRGRPWWHPCCNGNEGGWRTALCDYLEYKWRDTDYYDPNRYSYRKEVK